MYSILTVDDSLSVRQVLTVTLRGGGYSIIPANDGLAALAIAREMPVDLVITDVRMPGINGIRLVEALRELPAYASTPLLLLSADTSPTGKSAGREAGASGWINKPFNPGRLLHTVRQLLDQARTRGRATASRDVKIALKWSIQYRIPRGSGLLFWPG